MCAFVPGNRRLSIWLFVSNKKAKIQKRRFISVFFFLFVKLK